MGIDLEAVVITVGYVGLFIIVFAETGLLVGFFLPGDTLLITTGMVAQRGHFDIWVVIPLLILAAIAAIAGDATGYQIGRRAGPMLFRRDESRFFRRRHLDRARVFYDRHGGKTIVVARFFAIVRTFAPTVAGAAEMPYRRFAFYNISGGVLWITSMLAAGYIFGSAASSLEMFFAGVLAFFLIVSAAPALWHLWRRRRTTPTSHTPLPIDD